MYSLDHVIVTSTDEVFCVEEVEPNIYQSVFPSWLAEYSALHVSVEDAWKYIIEVIKENN